MHPIENKIILDKESPIFSVKSGDQVEYLELDTELDLYIVDCAKSLSSVTSSIEKTVLSLSLIDFNYLEFVSDEKHSKSAYIEMLIENSIIRVQSIYDRVLVFTNRLLNLGLSNESISHNLIITNEHVKHFGLDAKLKSINRSCNDYRFVRNTIIHHDRYTEEGLDRLTLIINADHLSKEAGKGGFLEEDELRVLADSYLSVKKSELTKYLDKIQGKVHSFYDSAIPVYEHMKQKLRARKI